MDWIYDLETYPNVFTCTLVPADMGLVVYFEVSPWRNDARALLAFCYWLKERGDRMVGFNNVGFDYPVLHHLIRTGGNCTARDLYDKAMAIIGSQDNDRWAHQVYPSDRLVPQIDLFKIHHFDNAARATSLKVLEFNMRMDDVSDLPFPVGAELNRDQAAVLRAYNLHDVQATRDFYHQSTDMIRFREELSAKYNRDFLNHNDTKIGKDYFIMRLEEAGVPCYEFSQDGRRPRQTPRPVIHLSECILPSIEFQQPEFQRVLNWLKQQSITETKGVFKNLVATVNGFDFVFGTGGIHGSVESRVFESTDDMVLIDLDVASYYPNLAIANRFYPEHLTERFCDIYKDLYEQRKRFLKGSAENAMLKLALNGTYGDSNSVYSPFYDPKFTMQITLNGQLLLCMLAEWLIRVPGLEMVQANTDGVTVYLPRHKLDSLRFFASQWEITTGLTLEEAEYSRMFIRDVNNYIAEYTNGKVKRKGAYEYDLDWHQNHSALVIPKVTEAVLLHDAPIRETVENWPDLMDFMLRVKVPRNSRLVGFDGQVDHPLQNTTRYYVANEGVQLFKLMPPTPKQAAQGRTEWRRIGVQSGWTVRVCNNMQDAGGRDVNYEYYIREIEKLTLGLR